MENKVAVFVEMVLELYTPGCAPAEEEAVRALWVPRLAACYDPAVDYTDVAMLFERAAGEGGGGTVARLHPELAAVIAEMCACPGA